MKSSQVLEILAKWKREYRKKKRKKKKKKKKKKKAEAMAVVEKQSEINRNMVHVDRGFHL